MKCANCNNDAVYVYRITEGKFTPYCTKDLPKFLESRRKAGLLETTEDHDSLVTEGLKTLIKIPETTQPEEVAPVVEKVVKKAAKKKAE